MFAMMLEMRTEILKLSSKEVGHVTPVWIGLKKNLTRLLKYLDDF